MKALIVGGGAREHALAWKLAQSDEVDSLLVAPGSDAIAAVAQCFPEVRASDSAALVALCLREAVGLVVIGPENPLAEGLTDRLREAGIPVFGPTQAAAQLESSKAYAKHFMARHSIPTSSFAEFVELDDALGYVRELGGPCVVKADGLAAGKGVTVCTTTAEAERALTEVMSERRFGEAGASVVVEERLLGEEVSFYAIVDGDHYVTLAPAQDHKRALDGDRGENTGGMGAYSPVPLVTTAVERRIVEQIVEPTVRGMAAEGQPFTGVLYVGLMVDSSGAPRVIEFNVRFGDPEIQALVMRMEDDLFPLLYGAACGKLDPESAPTRWTGASVCVVLASGGYPRDYRSGIEISGLDEVGEDPNVVVFHAGTQQKAGRFVTAGGRVLSVTARGSDIAEAARRAYRAADRIRFDGAQLRRDIAGRAISR
ncbi:MAG: phosphoribosylamine--glycine ligase [Myxococcota bacterium]|jgi:phosphoribosylamine--glycine ligase